MSDGSVSAALPLFSMQSRRPCDDETSGIGDPQDPKIRPVSIESPEPMPSGGVALTGPKIREIEK
jgi:hypothetical protein